MFEKEAEEYAQDMAKYYESAHGSIPSQFEKYLRKAVEFGYNKANEWHYVKDGDFPTDRTEKKYLVALKSEYSGFFYETDIWCESLHCFASNNPTKVYAWKEIVLPKEK